ncbi:hypothetical protein [Streptomyces sp. NPDC047000]|uniref:hypothetical protein n=1 Tax=Streptomyces sp. NPDC047000 TaxID=3155474 RepID=UPI0033DF7DB5
MADGAHPVAAEVVASTQLVTAGRRLRTHQAVREAALRARVVQSRPVTGAA